MLFTDNCKNLIEGTEEKRNFKTAISSETGNFQQSKDETLDVDISLAQKSREEDEREREKKKEYISIIDRNKIGRYCKMVWDKFRVW